MIGGGASAAASFSSGRSSGLDVTPVAPAWAATRGAADAFLVLTVDHAKKSAGVHAQGSGGYAALHPLLQAADGKAALFGALPYMSKGQPRHAFFCFLPPGLTGMARGRVSLQRAAVYAALEGVVGDLTLDDADAAQPAAVAAALSRIPGAQDVQLL